MKINRDQSEQIKKYNRYSQEIISPYQYLSPNKEKIQKITITKVYQPKIERASFTAINTIRGLNGNTPSKSYMENIRYNQTPSIKEEPEVFTKITKKIVKVEQPIIQKYNEKRVVKTITNTSNNNIENHNNFNSKSTNLTYCYTNPGMKNSSSYNSIQKNFNKDNQNNINTNRTPSKSIVQSSFNFNKSNISLGNSKYANNIIINNINNTQINNTSMNNKTRYSQKIPSLPKKVFSTNNYATEDTKSQIRKVSPVSPSDYHRRTLSPDSADLRRRTIDRGDPVKNVQITHVIYSTHPYNFHITEKLSREFLDSEPLRISQTDRYNLKKSGKSSWTSSVKKNIMPKKINLKGRTTIYQHAQGIGMTNDKKENINPLFYNSQIMKLKPIIKEKQKEKVEYMSFRNDSGFNSTRATYNKKNNYNNFIRTVGKYARDYNTVNNNNKSEIMKEIKNKFDGGNRSQFRAQDPSISTNNVGKFYKTNKNIKK